MSAPPEVASAEARVAAARARLFGTLSDVQQRLRPTKISQEAVESAAQGVASIARKGAAAARARPVMVAAIAGTIGLVLARGWIGDIVRRRHETHASPRGLKRKGRKGNS